MPLGEGFIKILYPEAILKFSHEHLPVRVDELDGILIKMGDVLPHRFKRVFTNVEEVVIDQFFVLVCWKLVD